LFFATSCSSKIMAYIPGSSLYGVKAFGDTGEAPNATAQPDVVQARASAPTELDKLQPAVQSIERGGNEETIELLKDIRQTQGASSSNPKNGGYLTRIPIAGELIGMTPLVDKIPLLGPMCFGKAAPGPSGQLPGTYTPWNDGGCCSGKKFGARFCGIAFKKPPCCDCCDCIQCSLPVPCNPDLQDAGFDCSLCGCWSGLCHLWLPQLTCCHVSMLIPVFHLLGWNPGCMCCMDGCKGIPIFCLPSCFKALFCGQYEDIDEGANSDVKGGGEPPTADSVVEAAIEAQA
jgi:hypothetical protein